MATFSTGRYLACTIGLTTAAARLVDLVATQIGVTPQDSWREVIIQVDPEGTAGQVRIGDATLGTLVPPSTGLTQKGATLAGGDSQTNTAHLNLVPAGSLYVQAVSGTPSINVQFVPL